MTIWFVNYLKSIAVVLMVLAHSIAFVYSGGGYLKLIQSFGDTVCFSIFLFSSGVVFGAKYLCLDDDLWIQKKANQVKSIIILYCVYLVVAFISSMQEFVFVSLFDLLFHCLKLLFLLEVPEYTEFILAFVLFKLIFLLFRGSIKNLILKKPRSHLLLWTCIFFFGGTLLYLANFGYPFVFYTSLFFGYKQWFRFPIFQYFPVFLFGIYLGYKYIQSHKKRLDTRTILLWFFGFSFISLLLLIIQSYVPSNIFFLFQRWPPSLLFLSTGMTLVMFLLLIPNLLRKDFSAKSSRVVSRSLGIYVFHIIILKLYKIFYGEKFASSTVVILIFLVVIVLSVFFTHRFWFLFGNFEKENKSKN
jgi:hypothetical protein